MPWWSCCQQLWILCEHTTAKVGLPSCTTDKAQKSWHQRRLLVHFWGARRPRSRSGTQTTTFVPISTAGSLRVGERSHFSSLLFLTKFCTFSLNVDLILPYTEVASDFQSETLTVFTVTSTYSANKMVTHTLNTCERLMTPHKSHLTYLLTYLLTYILHGAESFLRS